MAELLYFKADEDFLHITDADRLKSVYDSGLVWPLASAADEYQQQLAFDRYYSFFVGDSVF